MAAKAGKARSAKPTTIRQANPARQTELHSYCKDLPDWPRSWLGLPEDLPAGQRIVAYFEPFLEHLIDLNLSRKTIHKHANNLWILGGEIIRDLNETPSLRKAPVERLIFDVLQDEGPLLYHCDSEEELRSFESTCRKFRRFLEEQPL